MLFKLSRCVVGSNWANVVGTAISIDYGTSMRKNVKTDIWTNVGLCSQEIGYFFGFTLHSKLKEFNKEEKVEGSSNMHDRCLASNNFKSIKLLRVSLLL